MQTSSPYYTIEQLLGMISEPNRSACQALFFDNKELFERVPGALHNHQTWKGGYADHIQEIMNIGVLLYRCLSACRPLPFSLSDALTVVFLHDLEKPWKYEQKRSGERKTPRMSEKAEHAFRACKITQYHIQLSPEQQNALRYIHGEGKDYSERRRTIGPLGAFCHLCDFTSSRLWFDHPYEKHDPWHGAYRTASH